MCDADASPSSQEIALFLRISEEEISTATFILSFSRTTFSRRIPALPLRTQSRRRRRSIVPALSKTELISFSNVSHFSSYEFELISDDCVAPPPLRLTLHSASPSPIASPLPSRRCPVGFDGSRRESAPPPLRLQPRRSLSPRLSHPRLSPLRRRRLPQDRNARRFQNLPESTASQTRFHVPRRSPAG